MKRHKSLSRVHVPEILSRNQRVSSACTPERERERSCGGEEEGDMR